MSKLKKFLITIGIVAVALFFLSIRDIPEEITYGVSFSKFHTDELKLDWKETYLALLNDLGVKHFRFSAHWPNTEPQEGKYNFTELDFQMAEAQKQGADVILAVGRRLPGWPECHEPEWVKELPVTERREKLLKTIEVIVNRYKSNPALKYWQVENEPFFSFFSRSNCMQLNKEFLEKEIALVKKLDPSRPVILTSSGEFNLWFQAYKRADVFGSSLYLYVWWKNGPIRYPITPGFFRIKQNLVELLYGKKPKILIELSTEPWLLQPIITAPIELQMQRMGIDKFREIIEFSSKTGFDKQYLWGAEWWYWLKKQGYPEHWQEAQKLFNQ
ncbi:MAG: Uncharacterized protein G01um101444_138 [Parcubacteria group bacterium Gr01-1014_44]|nr:MAG: Uncharacterized protein G01um101444_138 [Parcubacteria group bacterium Gr01-1014_44]